MEAKENRSALITSKVDKGENSEREVQRHRRDEDQHDTDRRAYPFINSMKGAIHHHATREETGDGVTKKNHYSPVKSLSSGFFSSEPEPPEEGTSSTLTVASALLMTMSGVAFLGVGDFEREAVQSASWTE